MNDGRSGGTRPTTDVLPTSAITHARGITSTSEETWRSPAPGWAGGGRPAKTYRSKSAYARGILDLPIEYPLLLTGELVLGQDAPLSQVTEPGQRIHP